MPSPKWLTTKTVQAQEPGPHLLITAGIHGDEWEPMAAVRQLVGAFQERLRRGRVTLAPVVNEAAFARGRRTAEDELDLARVCPGRDDGSITERTAAALSRLIQSADFYVDLHTGGTSYKILPLTGYVLHSDKKVLEAQRAMAKAFGLPIVWGTSAALDGRSLSVARDALVPAIYVERGGGELDRAGVAAMLAGCLNVAARLGMVDRSASAGSIEHFVEDDRDQSGHLQVQHPAPMAGFFEPGVQLGSKIRQGDLLGEVVDVLGDVRAPVAVQSAGIVLFLRIAPSVQFGDGLGGTLPVPE